MRQLSSRESAEVVSVRRGSGAPCGAFAMLRKNPSALGLTVGALFGTAAYHATASSGVSVDGVLRGIPVSALGQFGPAVAWWAWGLLPPAAFLLGRSFARIAHLLVERPGTAGPLGLAASTGVILLLAWIGHLPANPAAAGPDALASVLFVGLSALLAALGQRFAALETNAVPSVLEPRGTAPALRQRGGRGSIHPSLAPAQMSATAPALRGIQGSALSFARTAALVAAMFLGACGGAVLVLGAGTQRNAVGAPGVASPTAGQSRPPGEAQATSARDADRPEPAPGKPGKRAAPELTFTTGYAAREAARAAADAVPTDAASGSRRAPPDVTVKKRSHRIGRSSRRHRGAS
jgi:hypothetical protein